MGSTPRKKSVSECYYTDSLCLCVSINSSARNIFAAKETAATSSLQGIVCKHILLHLRSEVEP